MKYCAARGAYRGAGSEALGQLVRNQPSDDSYLPGENTGEVYPSKPLLLLGTKAPFMTPGGIDFLFMYKRSINLAADCTQGCFSCCSR